jgi:hypothetical protein
MQHHPIHFHGHTFWLTGTEGGRIPNSAWIPRNNTLVGVAMGQDFEFIANNPGDWIIHCHMVHHMMNHMVRQVGPRIRRGEGIDEYVSMLPNRPDPVDILEQSQFKTPGYPQDMQGMNMNMDSLMKEMNKREARGMRQGWTTGVHGLMTVLRVLPDELYDRVMHGNTEIAPGEIFDAVASGRYQKRV